MKIINRDSYKMYNFKKIIFVAIFSIVFTGCATTYSNKELQNVFNQRGLETEETDQGVVVFVPGVFFEFDKADLTYCAQLKIGEIALIVNDSRVKQRNLLVEGHTDASGSEEYNQDLSYKRAKTVEQSLVNGKVAPERIMARGFGEKYPVAQNTNPDGTDNPEGRAKNRRVEIVVKNPDVKP
jgi:outer membrane protein OmpA-like peptidoglycan-associated protein